MAKNESKPNSSVKSDQSMTSRDVLANEIGFLLAKHWLEIMKSNTTPQLPADKRLKRLTPSSNSGPPSR